jgi:hypothetical protein
VLWDPGGRFVALGSVPVGAAARDHRHDEEEDQDDGDDCGDLHPARSIHERHASILRVILSL